MPDVILNLPHIQQIFSYVFLSSFIEAVVIFCKLFHKITKKGGLSNFHSNVK